MSCKCPELSYCVASVNMLWGDVVWGIERGYLTWRDIPEYALHRISAGGGPTFDVENEIYFENRGDASVLMDLARRAAAIDFCSDLVVQKWKYLMLRWIDENFDSLDDPLGSVAEIWADFGYPDDMRSFIHFLPPLDGWAPLEHNLAENYSRLRNILSEYVCGLGDGLSSRLL